MDLQKVLGKVFDTEPIKFLLREGETNVDRICIPLARTYDGLDISSYVFELRAESEKDTIARQVLTKVVGEDEVRLTWVVSSAFTAVSGWLEPVIVGLNSEGTEVIKITGDKIKVKQTQKSRIAATPNVIADALNEITLLTNRAIAAANLAEAASAKATADAAAAAASKTSATKSATTATGAATAAAADAKRAKEEADKAEAIAGFDVTDYFTKTEVSTQFEEKINMPQSISAGKDLDDYTTPGMFYAGFSGELVFNTPIKTGSFSLLVETTGSNAETGRKQTFTTYSTGDTFIRVKPSRTAWGAWSLLVSSRTAFNTNLLLNPGFIPGQIVNQRGSSNYTTGYGIDCWQQYMAKGVVELTNQGIKLYSIDPEVTDSRGDLKQLLDADVCSTIAGKAVTVSAYVKGSFSLYLNDGVRMVPESIADVTHDSFAVVSFTTTLPATAAKAHVTLRGRPNFPAIFQWVKLEIGTVATPFMPRHYAQELMLCQRRFIPISYDTVIAGKINNGGTYFLGWIYLPASMRAIPTIKSELTKWKICVDGSLFSLQNVEARRLSFYGLEIAATASESLSAVKGKEATLYYEGTELAYFDANIY